MPEIKHDFTAGKMNKDLDERVVPNGQYRDAMNIQIRTTAGEGGIGDAGAAQNLQGNSEVGTATGSSLISGFVNSSFTCVGAIADEKKDTAYFLFTSGDLTASDQSSSSEISKIDTIIEHNS